MGTKQMDNIMSVLPTSGNLLVWGLGNDSPYWHNSTSGKVVFLEDDDPTTKEGILWHDHITSQYPYLNAYKVHYTTKNDDSNFEKYMNDPWSSDLVINNFPKEVMETKWDVILVDAPLGWGEGNWGTGPGRYQSIYTTLQIARKQLIEGSVSTVHVFIDDYERRVENQYTQKVFGNKKPYRIIDREEGISNANRQAHFIFHKDHCIISNPSSCGNEDSRREVKFVDHRQQQYDNGVDEEKKSEVADNELKKKNNWVILLTINSGFYDFFLNWLTHYRKLNLSPNQEVIVVAEDDIVFDRLLNDRRIPTSFKIERSKLKSSDTEALDYESDSYKKMVSNRASILLDKLEDRLDIVYSDVDTAWLANPLPHVDDEFNKDSQVDVVAQTDDLPHEGTYPYYCTGFMAIKYNKRSIQFMKDWEVSLLEKPKLNQPIFNELLNGGNSDMKAQPLPHVQFPHGSSYYHGTESDRQKAVIFHNNYVIGHDVKKKRFRDYGLWLANDEEEGKTPSTLATLATTLLPAEAGAQKYRIQLNTLRALSYLRPDIDTVVFSNDNSSSRGVVVDEMCKSLGIRVINDFEYNPYNTPYIRSNLNTWNMMSLYQAPSLDTSMQISSSVLH